MDKLDKNQKLPIELLQEAYHYVKGKKGRKIWQLVCRGWYIAANDVARIKIKIPLVSRPLSNSIARDLEKYPTFGTKVISITDRDSNR